MNKTFLPPSELIINPDGSIYHLNLRPEQLAKTVITVGDPDRVSMISNYFDRIDTKVQKREFVTHTGVLQGKEISVISTGIGTDNIDIVFNELDALANIDFENRVEKDDHTALDIIRIGTSGCLQEDIPIDSFLISAYGLGLDGLMLYYEYAKKEIDQMAEKAFEEYAGGKIDFPLNPYIFAGGKGLIDHLGEGLLKGITVTCPGFYAPQGRQLRAKVKDSQLIPTLRNFTFQGTRITNFEMETAGIYGMSSILGHNAISCNALLANRINNTFSPEPSKPVKALIELMIERILSYPS